MSTVTQKQSLESVALDRVSSLFEALAARADRFRRYRRTLYELRALSTRELNDLGLTYTGLPRIARESVYGA